MNRYIQKLIYEQFNINDIDFTDAESCYDVNIFNKAVFDINKLYDKFLIPKKLTNEEISFLNNLTGIYKPFDNMDLMCIASQYSMHYPKESMNWLDLSEITSMKQLFNCKKYNGDISQWDVSHVTDMTEMFIHSKFNGDISGWNVSNVKNMSRMFAESDFNNELADWDVSNVNDMSGMFNNSEFNQDISGWDVSKVKSYDLIFEDCNIREEYKPIKFR